MASHWRWVEHSAWVVFEDLILVKSCQRGVQEMTQIAIRQASVESIGEGLEQKVARRTAELERAAAALQISNRELESTQKSLRDQELRLRTLFDNVIDPIITIDERGLIESRVNRATEQIF